MTAKSAATIRLNALANSYSRDADAMSRDPEHFTSYDVVAYSTIAKELRKIAVLLDEEPRCTCSGVTSQTGVDQSDDGPDKVWRCDECDLIWEATP